ncbi:MAG: hypothetical protein HYT80_09565 [Euryarchaeota archaeon]|nr:hypothetical protein [Euryarchaeota archaeon]
MLGLVVSLVLLRALFPAGKPAQGERVVGRLDRALSATPSVVPSAAGAPRRLIASQDLRDEGRKAGRRLRPAFVDEILAHVEAAGWGTPRILRILDERTVIRYYDCQDCRGRPVGHSTARECSAQAGFLQGAFERLHDRVVEVREIGCRRVGDPGCEFEVFA